MTNKTELKKGLYASQRSTNYRSWLCPAYPDWRLCIVEASNTTFFRNIREIKNVLFWRYESIWASNAHPRIENDLFYSATQIFTNSPFSFVCISTLINTGGHLITFIGEYCCCLHQVYSIWRYYKTWSKYDQSLNLAVGRLNHISTTRTSNACRIKVGIARTCSQGRN